MGGYKKGSWGKGSGKWASWDAWPSAQTYGKGGAPESYGGKSWPGGKDWQGGKDVGAGEATERTNRILARYQFPKAILRNTAAKDGSAFVKDQKATMGGDVFLGDRNLQGLITSDSSHLLRRPGVGVSEIAGSTVAGLDVLDNLKKTKLGELAGLFGGTDSALREAFKFLNTEDGRSKPVDALAESFATVARDILSKSDEFMETVMKAAIASSRVYVMATNLMQLVVALRDPTWWASAIPSSNTDHRSLQKWVRSPENVEKMAKAIGQLMSEKIDRAQSAADNSAAGLFGREFRSKRDAAGGESSDSDKGEKKSKAKRGKRGDAGRKRKGRASPSSASSSADASSSEQKKKKDKKKKNADKKAKSGGKAAKRQASSEGGAASSSSSPPKRPRRAAEKKKDVTGGDKAKPAATVPDPDLDLSKFHEQWRLSDAQTLVAKADEALQTIGPDDGDGRNPTAPLAGLTAMVPPEILEEKPELKALAARLSLSGTLPNEDARRLLTALRQLATDMEKAHSAVGGASAGSRA